MDQLKLSIEIFDATKELEKEIVKLYRESYDSLKKETAYFLERYKENNDLTSADMQRLMDKNETIQFRYTLEGYIEEIEKLGADTIEGKTLMNEYKIMAGKSRYMRYEELMAQLEQTTYKLGYNINSLCYNHFDTVANYSFYKELATINKTAGVNMNFVTLPKSTLDRIMSYPWSGQNFSENIWDNRDLLTKQLKKEIFKGIAEGKDYKSINKALQETMESNYFNTRRIVQTETAYFLEEGKVESFKEMDVEKYEIIAVLDSRTSETCQELDGKVFKLEERERGVNYPPLHPFCRTTTAPTIEDIEEYQERVARDKQGNNIKVKSTMNYEEYKKQYLTG